MKECKTTLTWRLREVMGRSEYRFGAQLARELQQRGQAITVQQVNRLMKRRPARLSVGLLAALMDILNCGVEDLLWTPARLSGARSPNSRAVQPESNNARASGHRRPPVAMPIGLPDLLARVQN